MKIVFGGILALLLHASVYGGTLRSVKAGVSESAPVQQVHIALSGDDSEGNPTGLAISWQTNIDTPTSTVRFGMKPGMYEYSATGTSSAYYETFHHHVVLPKLEENTEYFYIVGDEIGGWSDEYSAKSAPSSKNLRGNFSFAVFADLGIHQGEATTAYVNKIVGNDEVKLVWHGGDVGYADDSFLHKDCAFKFCYEETWDNYMQSIEPFASKVPYMVAVGNHEADCHDPACLDDKERREKLSNFTAYNTRFRMPSEESKSGALNMHYSFNYGPIHFISIDTETGYPGSAEQVRYVMPCGGFEEQLAWLEQDLIKANEERETRPWIFAQGHHPMYQGNSINKDFQAAMEKLFYDYGVDIYFSGHVHSYERDFPVFNGIVDPKKYENPRATTYLMIGGAGNDEMKNAEVTDPSPNDKLNGIFGRPHSWRQSDDNGAWTAVTDEERFGIGIVDIIDDNNLKFHYIRTSDGTEYDSMTLNRDHSLYINKFKN